MLKLSADEAKGICSIIRECAKSKVQKLTLGEMTIDFNVKDDSNPVKIIGSFESEKAQEEEQGYDDGDDEIKRKVDELENLMIEDPEEFEAQLADEQLNYN